MPQGVEHEKPLWDIVQEDLVKLSLMPQGVEHSAKAMNLLKLRNGETIFDAARR